MSEAPERTASLRSVRRLWWGLAGAIALVVPSPLGQWRPFTLVMWSLFGDPASPAEAWGGLLGGLAVLAIYTVVVRAFIRYVLERVLFTDEETRERR